MQDEPLGQEANPHAHTLAAPMLHFDLHAEAEQLRRQESYAKGSPTGRTLVKEPNLRVVLMALRAGATFEEHRASGPVSVQALEGTARLTVAGDNVELTSGALISIEPNIPHDVVGVGDTVVLITIGRTTYAEVSDRHEPHT